MMHRQKRFGAVLLLGALFFAAACSSQKGELRTGAVPGPAGEVAQKAAPLLDVLGKNPADVKTRLELVKLLDESGDPDGSLREANKGLQYAPADPNLLLYKAKALLSLGWFDQAGENAALSAKNGGGGEASMLAIQVFHKIERVGDALVVAKEWAAAEPQSADAHYWYARILAEEGMEEEGLAEYKRTLELNPNHNQALSVLSLYYEGKGETGLALELLTRLIKQNPHAEMQRIALIELLARQEKYQEAHDYLQKGLDFTEKPETLSRFAMMAAELGNIPLAVKYAEKLVAKEQGDGNWFLLGNLRARGGDSEGAAEAFTKVSGGEMKMLSDVLLAKIYKKTGKEEKAEEIISGYIEKCPKDEDGAVELVDYLKGSGRASEGVEYFKKYLRLHGDPDNEKFHFSWGVLLDSLGRWEESVERMNRVLAINPEEPYALNYIAYTWSLNGVKLEEAEAMVKKALARLPDSGPFLDTLGWIYYRMGKYAEALEQLELAAVKIDNDAIIWEHVGDAAVALGEVEKAKVAYEKALHNDPGNEDVKKKRAALK
ncbi:tetratricopeptide repeat protein [bacterium]|nr:MAG: tetratricopeptide repeat protein [bacterium]